MPRLLTDLRIAHGEGTIPKLYRDLARIEVLRGRSERMFGTLQKRLPQELRLAGITEMAEANRFLREVYLPLHNARFATPAEDKGSAFVPFAGALDDILCVQQERTVGNDNTVRYHGLSLHIPPARHRHHYVKARVRVHEYPDGTLALFHGPRCLARYNADGEPIDSQTPAGRVIRFAQPAGALWTSGQPRRARPLPHRPNHINRSGQLIWYINRSTQNLLIHEAQQGCRDATYEPSRFPVAVPYPSPHRATPAYVVVTSSDLDTSRNKASVSGLSWISRTQNVLDRRCLSAWWDRRVSGTLRAWSVTETLWTLSSSRPRQWESS